MPVIAVLALAACSRAGNENAAGIIHSKIEFLSPDFASERAALALNQFRLTLPYIAGDLYGSPTTGDFFATVIQPDYSFQIDLNRSEQPLLASLEPTDFSLSYLHIDPREARVARLAPMVLQADGIEQVGRTDWLDPDTRHPLLLLYFDRPARIAGQTVAGGRQVRYAIQAGSAGFVWVAQQTDLHGSLYTVVPKPGRIVLAVTPLPDAPPRAASPAHTGTPAQ